MQYISMLLPFSGLHFSVLEKLQCHKDNMKNGLGWATIPTNTHTHFEYSMLRTFLRAFVLGHSETSVCRRLSRYPLAHAGLIVLLITIIIVVVLSCLFSQFTAANYAWNKQPHKYVRSKPTPSKHPAHSLKETYIYDFHVHGCISVFDYAPSKQV